MKKLFLSMILMALPLVAGAYDCQVDGIYYNLIPKGNVAEVTYQSIDPGGYYRSDYSGSVTIPEKFTYEGVEYTVNSIGNYAFSNCNGLTSVTILNTLTSIGEYAFENCTGLTSVSIPNSVTSIRTHAFSNCSSLTSVIIPNSVTSIEWSAFSNCSGLTSVTIPNSVTSIGGGVFSNCSGLTSVTIPNSVTSFGWGAFQNCSGLTSIIIPNSVTSIGDYAFENCSSLTSMTIPNSVTSIGQFAFRNCSNCLTSIQVEDGNTKYDSRNNCNAIIETSSNTLIIGCQNTVIPNSVTSIGWGAFQNCSGLTSVTIPNSVISICGRAFHGCTGLTSITIPNSVTSIGSGAFAYCSKLEEVYCYAENIPYLDTYGHLYNADSDNPDNENPFAKSYPQYTNLYVLANLLNEYKTTFPWSEFGTIMAIEGSGTGEEPTKCATPTISYTNKELAFSCETEGVEFVSKITDADIKDFYSDKISLSATYEISVYATKSGYANSDVATATLVWTDAIFTETTPETPTSAKAVQESIPVLISAKGGNISVRCEADGQEVNVYTIDGLSLGTATVKNGEALISTSIPSGDIAVVKVGGRSVKVIMR